MTFVTAASFGACASSFVVFVLLKMQQRMMYVYSRYLDKSDLDKAIHTSARRGPSVVVAITNAGAYTATFEYSTFPSSSVDMLAFALVIVVGVVRPDSVYCVCDSVSIAS